MTGQPHFRWLFPVFALAALLINARLLTAFFQEDDFDLLRAAMDGPFGKWTFAPSQFFRPLVSVTIWFQKLFGLDPTPFRVFNLLVHAANAALVAVLVYAVLRPTEDNRKSRIVSIGAGILFLVAPSHAEAVNWISARTDLLATLFGLISLWAFVRYVQDDRREMLAASAAAYVAALLCKESAVIVPVIALVYAGMVQNRAALKRGIAVFGALVIVYFAVRIGLIGPGMNGGLNRNLGFKTVGATAVDVVRTLFPGLPFGDPDLNNAEALATQQGITLLTAGLLTVGALIVFSMLRLKEKRTALFLWIAFAVALAPAAGLSVRLFRSTGERFLYFPSVFLIAALACALLQPDRQQNTDRATLGQKLPFTLCSGVFVFLLLWQNRIWREGADLAQRIQSSFLTDVVDNLPNEKKEIAILDLPPGVQGSYGVAYALGAIPPLYRGREMHVQVLTVYTLRTLNHEVFLQGAGNLARIKLGGGTGRLDLEATATARRLDINHWQGSGFIDFTPTEAVLDLNTVQEGTPIFGWNGHRFIRLR